MLRRLFNYIADSFSWRIDNTKTGKNSNKSFNNISNIAENIYMINKRTGDRKIEIGRYSTAPPDMAWLAQTENTGIINDPYTGSKTYTKAELQEHLAKCKDNNDRQPKP